MTNLRTLVASLMLATMTLASGAAANDKTAVNAFYAFLSNPGSKSHAETFRTYVTDDWHSVGDYSGKKKSVKAFIGQLGFFAKLIPNLDWKIEEMIQAGNQVVVRGRATGTPGGPLFGVDGKGKSFEIMSIDIHTLKDGKIAKSYHVEDWAGALRQLKAK